LELISTAIRIVKNIGTLCLDLGRVLFAGVALLAEGITWGVVTAGDVIINRLPSSKDEKPAVQAQQAHQPPPNKQEVPPLECAGCTQTCANEEKPVVGVKLHTDGNEVHASANVNVSRLSRLKRKLFG
jgi:hypothetical protein